MSFKFRNKIVALSNEQLINLLKDNNYDFEEVLVNQGITGKQFLDLREIDFVRWKVSLREKKQLWHCVTELNNNPGAFFSKPDANLLKKSQNLSCNKPKISPPSLPLKSDCIPKTLYYDKDGYLLPIEKSQYAEPKTDETEYTYIDIKENKESPKLAELFIDNFKKCAQFSVSRKKKPESLQKRPLPQLPQEASSLNQDGDAQNFGGKVAENGTWSPEKVKLFCWTSPTRTYIFDWLFKDQQVGSVETPPKPLVPSNCAQETVSQPKKDKEPQLENAIDNDKREPYFRDTDRKGAQQLLHDLPDGAFLLRKSDSYYRVLTFKYHRKYINIGIEKLSNGMLKLSGKYERLSDFADLGHLIDYFTENSIRFVLPSGEIRETLLKKCLPTC